MLCCFLPSRASQSHNTWTTTRVSAQQYEARLQFAPEFAEPTAQLRRLRPDTLVYSYEWFVDDPLVVQAVEHHATIPVTLPQGWMLADVSEPTERSEEAPPASPSENDMRL